MRVHNTEIACRITEKALRNRVIGGKHYPVEAILRLSLSDSQQGEGRDVLVNEMIPNHVAGFAYVKGNETVTITDPDKAVEFLEKHGGNVPFNFQ